MKAKDVCATAARLVSEDRAKEYGSMTDVHTMIAEMWSSWTGVPLTAHDVAVMMVLLKAVRSSSNPAHEDNYIDMAGYAGIASQVQDADH